MRAHAQADYRYFAHAVVAVDFGGAQTVFQAFHQFQSRFVIAARNGEGEIGGAFVAHVLDNHVHFDVGIGNSTENLIGNAGFVGYAAYVDTGLVFIECDTGYGSSFHVVVLFKGN